MSEGDWGSADPMHDDSGAYVADLARKTPRRWNKTPTDETPILRTEDPINHPQHYTGGKIECIDAIESAAEGWPSWATPMLANVQKYTWRAFKKGKALRDLRKAQWYLNRAIETLLNRGYTETEQ